MAFTQSPPPDIDLKNILGVTGKMTSLTVLVDLSLPVITYDTSRTWPANMVVNFWL